MKTLRERNREHTHQQITEAARELFLQNGYEQTTMSNIAVKAEVSRATLFNYFPSKGDLLLAIAQTVLRHEIEPAIRAVMTSDEDLWNTFRALFAAVAQLLLNYPDLTEAMIGHFAQGKGRFGESQNGETTGFSGTLYALIERGKARGEVRTDLDSAQLANYLNVLHTSVFIAAHQNAAQYQRGCEALLNFLRGGLLTYKTAN